MDLRNFRPDEMFATYKVSSIMVIESHQPVQNKGIKDCPTFKIIHIFTIIQLFTVQYETIPLALMLIPHVAIMAAPFKIHSHKTT
jgi:hypothetical protein